MTPGDELPKPPKAPATITGVRQLADDYARAYQAWHSEFGTAQDLRTLIDGGIALTDAIEQLAAEQFEAGRQQERALWELAKDGQEIG